MIRPIMNLKKLSSAAAFALTLIATLNASAWSMASRATDPNAPQPPAWIQWAPMVVLFGIFYFLMIRPQAKQRKERENLLNNLKKGDKIVTQSGFIATINSVGPRFLEVKLADEVRVTMLKSGVTEVLPSKDEVELTTLAAAR